MPEVVIGSGTLKKVHSILKKHVGSGSATQSEKKQLATVANALGLGNMGEGYTGGKFQITKSGKKYIMGSGWWSDAFSNVRDTIRKTFAPVINHAIPKVADLGKALVDRGIANVMARV